jgi:hypothetical protein
MRANLTKSVLWGGLGLALLLCGLLAYAAHNSRAHFDRLMRDQTRKGADFERLSPGPTPADDEE